MFIITQLFLTTTCNSVLTARGWNKQIIHSFKSREVFCPEKPFVKPRPAYSVKLVSSYVVKGIKIKVTAKFGASRRLRFENTKRIVARNMPEMFRDFRETGPWCTLGTVNESWFFSSNNLFQIILLNDVLEKVWGLITWFFSTLKEQWLCLLWRTKGDI